MEDFKKYEKLLENLGEEVNNYDYVLNMVKDIKSKSIEENIKVPDDIDSMGKDFITDDYQESEENYESKSDSQIEEINLVDPVVDQIFKNIDTEEYRQKREKGGFKPKFVESSYVPDEEEEEIEVPEEVLESVIGQSEDVFEIKSNIAMIENEMNKLEEDELNIDDILRDAEKVIKDVKKDKKSLTEEIKSIEKEGTEESEYEEGFEGVEGIEEFEEEGEPITEIVEEEGIPEEVKEPISEELKDLDFELQGEEGLEDISTADNVLLEGVKTSETEIGEVETVEEPGEFIEEKPEEIKDVTEKSQDVEQAGFEDEESDEISNLKSFVEGSDIGSDVVFELDEESELEKGEIESEYLEETTEKFEEEEIEEPIESVEVTPSKEEKHDIVEEQGIEEEYEKPVEEQVLLEDEIPIEKEEEESIESKEISEEHFDVGKIEEIESEEEFDDLGFDEIEKDYKNLGLEVEDKKVERERPFDKKTGGTLREEIKVEKKEEKKDISDKLIQFNLNKLPVSLLIRFKEIMGDPSVSPATKHAIKSELSKERPDFDKIKYLLGYEEREAKNFVPVFKFATVFVILGIILSIFYFALLKPYLRNRSLLISGLEDIKNGNYVLANEKFERASPSLSWYNRYALEFMKYNAYKQAEEKLMGIRGPAYEVIKKGAVDIDPDDRETRLNIARVFEEQGMYEKVLENDVNPKMQFDDSLYYLYKKDPEDFSIVDKIGLTYVKWGNSFRKRTQKIEKYEKAQKIYTDFYESYSKEPEVISRILYTSALTGDKVEEKFDNVQSQGMLEKMHDLTLAEVGNYFINNDEYKRTQKIMEVLNNMDTTNPYVYYIMGKFYYNIGNLKLAEKALVKAERFSWEIENEIKKKVNDEKNYSNIMNMLGTLYISLANEYKGENEENKRKREEFINLAYYHFNQAKKYDPNNKETYYRYANMMYDYYSDYLKSSENYLISYNLYREEEEIPPLDMYYKLSTSFYFLGDYDKSLDYLNDLRMNPSFRIRPAIEYLLGMLYFKKGLLLDSRQRFVNTQEYYNKEIESYIRNPNPMSIRQNKILFFNSILYNNIGVVYHLLADRENNNDYYNIARVNFYKAIELAHRYNNKTIQALARLNLNDSIFQDNMKYVEHFNIKREPILYDYIPKYLEEYE